MVTIEALPNKVEPREFCRYWFEISHLPFSAYLLIQGLSNKHPAALPNQIDIKKSASRLGSATKKNLLQH